MILFVDPAFVSDKFTSLFSFIPFSVARPIISAFFKAIKERNNFAGTLRNIKKDEAIKAQLNYGRTLSKAKIYDSRRCTKCHQILGCGDCFCANCGHVFHVECSKDGWCPICCKAFRIPMANNEVKPSLVLENFDRINDTKGNDFEDLSDLQINQNKQTHEENRRSISKPLLNGVTFIESPSNIQEINLHDF